MRSESSRSAPARSLRPGARASSPTISERAAGGERCLDRLGPAGVGPGKDPLEKRLARHADGSRAFGRELLELRRTRARPGARAPPPRRSGRATAAGAWIRRAARGSASAARTDSTPAPARRASSSSSTPCSRASSIQTTRRSASEPLSSRSSARAPGLFVAPAKRRGTGVEDDAAADRRDGREPADDEAVPRRRRDRLRSASSTRAEPPGGISRAVEHSHRARWPPRRSGGTRAGRRSSPAARPAEAPGGRRDGWRSPARTASRARGRAGDPRARRPPDSR